MIHLPRIPKQTLTAVSSLFYVCVHSADHILQSIAQMKLSYMLNMITSGLATGWWLVQGVLPIVYKCKITEPHKEEAKARYGAATPYKKKKKYDYAVTNISSVSEESDSQVSTTGSGVSDLSHFQRGSWRLGNTTRFVLN
jgi:hypothetical protein